MTATVQNDIIETFKKLNEILDSFSDEEINIVPFEGSWTGGQLIQHLILACSDYPKLFNGNKEKTNRKPDEQVKGLKDVFLNFDTKMDSPDFLKPEIKDYNKNLQTLSLLKIESELLNASETHDLTLLCLDFQLPDSEKFTIFEWINFALIHIQRHTKQLNNIYEHIRNNK